MKSILRECIREAQRKLSRHDQPWKHFSFIVADKVISCATNKTAPPLTRYGYPSFGKLHSETEAFRKCRSIVPPAYICINIRLNRDGSLRNSCPCDPCFKFLKYTGCTSVYFTTSHDFARIKL